MAAGDGLCDERAVQVLVEDGPRYVRELMAWGARFDRDAGRPARAGHRRRAQRPPRPARARCDGPRDRPRAVGACVAPCPASSPTHTRASSICSSRTAAAPGRRFLADDGGLATARAPLVLLATGGAGQVYSETTNPHVATGDGVAMAFRAGAAVADLEFVQFHPTALNVPGQPRFLLSEALRGEGARLVNADGEAFMARYDPAGDLAPRDRVSRAIVRESERTGQPIFLSLEELDPDFVHERFPLISERAAAPASTSRATGFRSVRPPITSWAACRRISTAERRCRVCSRPARWRARACTGRTGSPATRCSKGWCSAPAPGGPCARGARVPRRAKGAKGARGAKGATGAGGAEGARGAT